MSSVSGSQGFSQDISWMASSRLKLDWGKICFQVHMAVGSTELLVDCYLDTILSFCLIVARGCLSPLLHRTFLDTCFLKANRRQNLSERWTLQFYVTQSHTSHHLYHVLLVRRKSQPMPTLRGRGLHKNLILNSLFLLSQ